MERRVRINLERILDKEAANDLKEKFNSFLEMGCNEYELDMSKMKFINLTGLAVIFYISKKTCENGFELKFLSPSSTIKKILMITNADMYARIIEKDEVTTGEGEKSISERYINEERNLEEFVLNIIN